MTEENLGCFFFGPSWIFMPSTPSIAPLTVHCLLIIHVATWRILGVLPFYSILLDSNRVQYRITPRMRLGDECGGSVRPQCGWLDVAFPEGVAAHGIQSCWQHPWSTSCVYSGDQFALVGRVVLREKYYRRCLWKWRNLHRMMLHLLGHHEN